MLIAKTLASLDNLSGALDGALAVICPRRALARHCRCPEPGRQRALLEMINRVNAETFGLFMIYGNRAGFEDGVGFWGVRDHRSLRPAHRQSEIL